MASTLDDVETHKSQDSQDDDPITIKIEGNHDVILEASNTDQPKIRELKDADYSSMKKIDNTIVINPSLKIGTGDDELVDNIVAGAKSSLGGIGSIIPDEIVSSTLKGAKVSNL